MGDGYPTINNTLQFIFKGFGSRKKHALLWREESETRRCIRENLYPLGEEGSKPLMVSLGWADTYIFFHFFRN